MRMGVQMSLAVTGSFSITAQAVMDSEGTLWSGKEGPIKVVVYSKPDDRVLHLPTSQKENSSQGNPLGKNALDMSGYTTY